jgi:hypothetical protein
MAAAVASHWASVGESENRYDNSLGLCAMSLSLSQSVVISALGSFNRTSQHIASCGPCDHVNDQQIRS